MTLVVGIIAFVAGLALGALWGALANMAGAADERNYAAEIIVELEKRLRICQEVSVRNQQAAETYYQLYRNGARANAQLQKGNGYATVN